MPYKDKILIFNGFNYIINTVCDIKDYKSIMTFTRLNIVKYNIHNFQSLNAASIKEMLILEY